MSKIKDGKVKKMAFGGLSRAFRKSAPTPPPRNLPKPVAAPAPVASPAPAPVASPAPAPDFDFGAGNASLRGTPESKAIADRVLRMAVRREAPDMRFATPGRDKITSADALRVLKGFRPTGFTGFKKGGAVKPSAFKKAAVKSSASKRGDGIATKGKTRGKIV